MRPIGVSLLCTIMDKFAAIPDPELPDHLLLEQYQAQLVSAVRSALDSLSGPILLEAGLQLATKMLISGFISRDQLAVKRIFSLISCPLDDFNDLYYPSYAEWVSCKIKVRLLTVHASLKCYMFAFLRRQGDEIPDEYLALLPLFAKSSSILGTYWLSFLKDYSFVHFHLQLENWKPFLDGIQSSGVSVELQPCLEEAWPMILQALVLDAVPANSNVNESSPTDRSRNIPTSGYSMVELGLDDFQFLWGFLLLVLFQEQDATRSENIIPVSFIKSKFSSDISIDDSDSSSSKLYDIFFPVFQFMSTERFFKSGFLTLDACRELLQVFSYLIFKEDTWDYLAVIFLSQVLQNCPKDFLEVENFAYLATELCLASLFKSLSSSNVNSQHPSCWENTITLALSAASTLLERFKAQMQLQLLLPFLLIGYKCVGKASTETSLSRISDFVQSIALLLKRLGKSVLGADENSQLAVITRACLNAAASLTNDCIQSIHQVENKKPNLRKMLLLKLGFSVEQLFSYAALAVECKGPAESQEMDPVLSRVLHLSVHCVQAVLTDSDIQIQAVGLQVVKVMLRKGLGAESNSFLIFYVGELVEDLCIIVRNILKNPINREAVVIAGECLKILMLLQTLSNGSDYQKCIVHLLLEAILMIFSTSDGSLSQEAKNLRSIAVKLVSQVAQIPSSAVHIKEILLAMPAERRLQLQDIIRASVIQDKDPKQSSSSGPPLVIKLPSQTEQNAVKKSLQIVPPKESNDSSTVPLDPPKESNDNSAEEEDEDEDDDWDTFQSFPASGTETSPAPENSASLSLTDKENLTVEDQELDESATTFQIADGGNQMEETQEKSDEVASALQDKKWSPTDQIGEENTKIFAEDLAKTETGPTAENNQPLSDVQHLGSAETNDGPSDELHEGNISESNEQEKIPEMSKTDSQVISTNKDSSLEDHERTGDAPVGPTLSNYDKLEGDSNKSPGN